MTNISDFMDSPYRFLQARLDELKIAENLRTLSHAAAEGRYIIKQGRRMLNLSSNDYLGLAVDMNLRADFLRQISVKDFVPSASSSRLLTGNHPIFDELETELAKLYNAESALLFNSGYDANSGILPAIANNDDTLILADKLVHASLIDGIRLSHAKCIRFRHNDLNHLERLISKNASCYRHIILVTESIFSMDGDEAPLREMVDLKRRYPNIMLYVDEAHAFGLRGSQGLGCCEEAGILPDIDLLVGTLGKAAASAGAFVICAQTIRDYLINHVRPFIFTTALPPFTVAWSLYIVHNLPQMSARRERLSCITKRVHQALATEQVKDISQSHIIPLLIGSSADAMLQADAMQRHGFYILPVRPPTVPEGTARLRLSLRADLTDEETERLIEEATATPQLHSYETASTRTNNS